MDDEFPKIQRGNGVMNDNLATLGDIMLATKKNIDDLESSTNSIKEEVGKVKDTIQRIDKQNTPREIKSFWLIVVTVILSAIGVIISVIALFR